MAAHDAGFWCPGARCVRLPVWSVRRGDGYRLAMKAFGGSGGRGCSPGQPVRWSVAAGLERMRRRGPGLRKHAGLGLPLAGSGEPRFAGGVTGPGRFGVPAAGQALQRDRLAGGEQPEDGPVRSVAGWRRWPRVTRPAR